jgi:hypothetical protein
MQRVQRKIYRCLGELGVSVPAVPDADVGPPDRKGVLLAVLGKLEDALVLMGIDLASLQAEKPGANAIPDGVCGPNNTGAAADEPNRRAHWANRVRCIYTEEGGKAIVVFRHCKDSPENRKCISETREFCNSQGKVSLLLTERLFAYYLRHLKPYDYRSFPESAIRIFGDDFYTTIKEPDAAALTRELLRDAPLLLMFPQSQDFFQPGVTRAFDFTDLEYMLDRTLALKVYLDTGQILRSISGMLREFNATYQRHAEEIARMKQLGDVHPNKQMFALLRDVLDDIHTALSAVARRDIESQSEPLAGFPGESCGKKVQAPTMRATAAKSEASR